MDTSTPLKIVMAVCCLFVCVFLSDNASATEEGSTSKLCDSAAQIAASEYDIPLNIMFAITRTETGQSFEGFFGPWPWAVNIEGRGRWLSNKTEALTYVSSLSARGIQNFDVGCFQINNLWHGMHFKSLNDMLEPLANARYAARFLKALFFEHRDWYKAVGAFHSRKELNAEKYLGRFYPIYASLETFPIRYLGQSVTSRSENSFPLLNGQVGSAALGSLFPDTTENGQSFIALQRNGD